MFNFEKHSKSIAAIDDAGREISYGALAQFSLELAAVAKRKLCFNFCENSIGSLAGYACMIDAGAVPVMLSRDLDKALAKNLLRLYEPEFLWLPSEMSAEFSECKTILQKYSYSLLRTHFNSAQKLNDALALLLTTSGSTGSPKLVRQSYANIKSNTLSIIEYLKINSAERPATLLPMNYTYGISVLNTHLFCGAKILLTEKSLMQKEFWNFIKAQKATSIAGVPYTYEMLKKLRFFKMDLPHLKTMTQAGGKLSLELHKEFAQFAKESGKSFFVMYGQTEATARMGFLPAEKALEKAGSMGIAIPGGTFSLTDEEGREIAQSDTIGELIYKGENVALGYAECRADLEKGDENCGVLFTGDIAKRDAEGFYCIVGRKKRFLKMFGKRVNLDEIESLVRSRFSTLDCATSGADDRLCVFVTDGQKCGEVQDFICQTARLNASAVSVKFIEKIPRSDSGKIQYTKLESYD